MKKFLLTTISLSVLALPAMAADLPVYKAPVAVPVCIWCGWYVGGNVGGGYAESNQFVSTETFNGGIFTSGTWPGQGNFGNLNPSGAFGGGQLGYNFQTGAIVFGVETDFEGSGIRGTAGATLPYIVAPNTVTETLSSNLDWFGTLRGRVGYTWGPALLFATGGLAYGQVKNTFTYTDTLGFAGLTSTSSTRTGFTVGAGIEYMFLRGWSAKFEYQYIDLGSAGLALTEAGPTSGFADFTQTSYRYNTFRGGVNYHF
jgi:outer membrane immunogenic protein